MDELVEKWVGSLIYHNSGEEGGKVAIKLLQIDFDRKFPEGSWDSCCKSEFGTFTNYIKESDCFEFHSVGAGMHQCSLTEDADIEFLDKKEIYPDKKKHENLEIIKQVAIDDWRDIGKPRIQEEPKKEVEEEQPVVEEKPKVKSSPKKKRRKKSKPPVRQSTSEKSSPKKSGSVGKKKLKRCIALHDFTTNYKDELSIKKDDKLLIHLDDGDWLYVQVYHSRLCGFVPANHVKRLD